MLMINNINKKVIFKKMSYIYYLIQFYQNKIWALINNGNKINAMSPNYTQKLGLKV